VKRLLAATFGVALVATSCGGGGGSPAGNPTATPSGTEVAVGPVGAPSPAASASAAPSTSHAPLGTVRLALDWTPNTNHTGFYVAAANGWYGDAGVDFRVLPYGTTAPEALVGAGQAECGISFQDSLTFAVAAGAPIVSALAILQHTAQVVAVLDSSTIARPRDLDGRTYAGFGYPNEEPTLKAVIKADGGKGTFKTVTLDTAAYDALYAKRADFVIMFTAWEGVEAKERGIAIRTFAFDDYGFPDFYQVVLACNRGWLAAKPELARAFLAATVRGFQLAATDPDAAAALLIAQNPGVFDGNPKLPVDSQRFLASAGLLTDESGQVGRQTLAKWQGYSGFLFKQGLLTGVNGKPLTTAPDYGSLFTNDYLP
jgi:ABC-type nitrate/sulfonate/bicarbonate transport system substrate-binding protein